MKDVKEPNGFDLLADEQLVRIFSYLKRRELLKKQQVCKKWKQVTESHHFWKKEGKYNNKAEYPKYKLHEATTLLSLQEKRLQVLDKFVVEKHDTFKLACVGSNKGSFIEKLRKETGAVDDILPKNLVSYHAFVGEIKFEIWESKKNSIGLMVESLLHAYDTIVLIFSDDKNEIDALLARMNVNLDKPVCLITSQKVHFPKLYRAQFAQISINDEKKPALNFLNDIYQSLRELAESDRKALNHNANNNDLDDQKHHKHKCNIM